jgi:hypothetical protein
MASESLISLSSIFSKHGTDKGPEGHNYCRQYESLLARFRNQKVRLLEIGVHKGNSLRMWRDVFPSADMIVGLDVIKTCAQHQCLENNIYVEIGDATTPAFISKVTEKYGPFDIIIDDGGHTNTAVIKSFELLFPHVKENGLYIVEDTNCYDLKRYHDNAAPHHLEYFWRRTRALNIHGKHNIRHCSDPFKLQRKPSDVPEASIDKIEFGCSYIGITKLTRHHWLPLT